MRKFRVLVRFLFVGVAAGCASSYSPIVAARSSIAPPHASSRRSSMTNAPATLDSQNRPAITGAYEAVSRSL